MRTDPDDEAAKYWLVGAALAAVSSFVVVAGLSLQRYAHVRSKEIEAGKESDSSMPPNHIWFSGSALLWIAFILSGSARKWTPGITVVTVQTLSLLVNCVVSPAALLEKYGFKDLVFTFFAIAGVLTAAAAQTAEHELPRPKDRISLTHAFPMSYNTGFMMYAAAWTLIVLGGFIANCYVRCLPLDRHGNIIGGRQIQRFTLPLLAGFFFAAWQNFLCVGVTTLTNSGHLQIADNGSLAWSKAAADWTNPGTLKPGCLGLMLLAAAGAGAFSHFNAGTEVFECRYITTTALSICMATMSATDVLFSEKWYTMSKYSIIIFIAANLVSVLAAFLVTAVDTRARSSFVVMKEAQADPLLKSTADLPELQVVEVSPGPKTQAIVDTWWWQAWFAVCRAMPLMVVGTAGALPAIFFLMPTTSGHTWFVFCAVTLYTAWATYEYGFHIFVFSVSGQKKVDIALATDFKEKYRMSQILKETRKQEKAGDETDDPDSPGSPRAVRLEWEDVYHVVVFANYKEHLHIMREATDSVAASGLAKSQIIVVFACEMRDPDSQETAATLIAEYKDRFMHVMATFHPPDIPGEMPSKAANMHWAANRVFEYVDGLFGVGPHQVVLTVADADSNFHPNHFDSLAEAFLSAGSTREETIWQAPIMHYLNYHDQIGVVRLASIMCTLHELAFCADPTATILVYSTYSIPLRLLKAVGDFDPDWLSEDWHIGIKCRLATVGRCRVRATFLPILNYAPEDESWMKTLSARFTQAKRHALGFTELSYVFCTIPIAWASFTEHRWSKLGTYLWNGVFPLTRQLLAVHGIMSTTWMLVPLNSYMMYHFWSTNAESCIGSWTYMVDVVCMLIAPITQAIVVLSGVFLYEQQKHRVAPPASNSTTNMFWFKYKFVHWLRVFIGDYIIAGPIFFVGAGWAEWLAAFKALQGHKFAHDVALKHSDANRIRGGTVVSASDQA